MNVFQSSLSKYHLVHIDQEWISDCIEYIQSNFSNNQKEEFVRQLLYTDLRAITVKSNLVMGDTISIPREGITVQIMDIEEVGISCQEQLEAISQNKPPKRKMLKLLLSDGIEQFYGIELNPINNVNLLTVLGSKARIANGTIHRGVLLLDPAAFTFYGGSVDQLNVVSPEDRVRMKLIQMLHLTHEQYVASFKPSKKDTPMNASNESAVSDDEQYFDQMDDELVSQVVVKNEFIDDEYGNDFDSIDPDYYINI